MQNRMYPLKLHRSAMAPDTMVAHVAANVLCNYVDILVLHWLL